MPATTTVALVPQEPDRSPAETARAYVARRTGVAAATRELADASAALSDLSGATAARYDAALDAYVRLGCGDFDERLAEVAAEVGLPTELLDRPTAHLSGGEAARVALVAALVARADVLLLDEPTNDLDADGLATLEVLIDHTSSALVVVSHDRVFLEHTVTSVIELAEDGSASTFDGGWTAYLAQRAAQRRRAAEAYARYDEERRRLRDQARREREWAHKGVRRAATSGETDKFIRFGAKQGAQNGGKRASRTERELARLEPVDKPWEGWELRFSIAPAERAGDVVAELDGATVVRGERRLGPWVLTLTWGERVVLHGPNGAGKTTIVDLLTGRLRPDSGTVRLGPSVVLGELRQERVEAAATGDLLAWFLDRSGLAISEGRSLLAKFGLSAEHLARPPSSLSTGERTRAALALFQARAGPLVLTALWCKSRV